MAKLEMQGILNTAMINWDTQTIKTKAKQGMHALKKTIL